MPQPTPTPPPPQVPVTPPETAAVQADPEGEGEQRQCEQLAALHEATAGGLTVLALLGQELAEPGGWGSAAYLARENTAGALVVAALNERTTSPGNYDVTLWRELDESLPGPTSWCPHCSARSKGWLRFCGCGTDLSGIIPGTEEEGAQLLRRAEEATADQLELLGALPYAGGGGLAYFARHAQGGAVVAFRMHAEPTLEDDAQHISLAVSEPLGEVGSAASSIVGRSPHSGPIRFTPVDSISVVTEETAARHAVSGPQPKNADPPDSIDARLRGSILGSGLLAQQPTPSEQEAVVVAKVCPQCGAEYDTASRFCPNDGTPLRSKGTTDSFVGQVLAERYHILKRLGEGGMGKVYLAEHVKMNRQCAVKVMNAALLSDAESAQRFAREASNAARIIHPNVAAVFDYGECEGIVYLVMEYVDGEPLSRILERETALTPNRAVDIAHQVAEALVAAHELGIVHRDLKPDNIIVAPTKNRREIAKVVDFGIAKALEEGPGESLTHTGLVIGTPEYMSPEQLLGDPVDARSDIYSLGCILYQMLTGHRSFDEPTREAMIKRRLTEKAPHPRDLIPTLPKTLDLVVARMLARAPQDRYGTAAEVRDLLIPAIALEGGFDDPSWRPSARSNPTVFIQAAEQPTQEMTPYPGVTSPRPIWRRRRIMAAAVGALALGLIGLVVIKSVVSGRNDVKPPDAFTAPAKPSPASVQVITVPQPTVAQLPGRSGATAASRVADSITGSNRDAVKPPPADLQQPILGLKQAMESGLVARMEDAYKNYDQDPDTKTYWKQFLDKADTIHVKALTYQSYTYMANGNRAELRFKTVVGYGLNGSKTITGEASMVWRAVLLRVGPRAPWKIEKLTPIKP